MKSFTAIIDKFGTVGLARLLGVAESHVRVMKVRDSIPPEYWGALVAGAEKRGLPGITHSRLVALRRRRRAERDHAGAKRHGASAMATG